MSSTNGANGTKHATPEGKVHLVTGGAGYFGTLLVDALVKEGKRVRILDLHDADLPAGVEKHRADIRDRNAVERACEDVEVVHHNVALVPLAKDKEAFWEVNEGGTRNLLEAAKKQGVRKIVSMSSSAVYGAPDKNPVDDATPTNPGEDYGKAKLGAEKLCHQYAKEGLDITLIRPRTIMGHGRLGIMQILFEWIREGRNIPVLGRGDNLYQFVHADDLASAALKAAERPNPKGAPQASIYTVGAEIFGTMRETLESLCRHAGTGSQVRSLPAGPAALAMRAVAGVGLAPFAPYHWLMYSTSLWFDIEHAREALGWQPRSSNEEAIAASYDWFLANRAGTDASAGVSHHRHTAKQGALKLLKHATQLLPRR